MDADVLGRARSGDDGGMGDSGDGGGQRDGTGGSVGGEEAATVRLRFGFGGEQPAEEDSASVKETAAGRSKGASAAALVCCGSEGTAAAGEVTCAGGRKRRIGARCRGTD